MEGDVEVAVEVDVDTDSLPREPKTPYSRSIPLNQIKDPYVV